MSQVSGELSDGQGMGKVTYTSADWYEQRKAWISQGQYQERERIIKLLETEYEIGLDVGMIPYLILLIKGEQK